MPIAFRGMRRLQPAALLASAAVALRASAPRIPLSVGEARAWLAHSSPDGAIVTAVATAAWLLLAWLAVGAGLVAAARVPGTCGRLAGRLGRLVLPRAVRRAVEIALGLAVVAGVAAPAGVAAADIGGAGVGAAGRPPVAGQAVPGNPISLDRPASGWPEPAARPVRPTAPVRLVAAAPRGVHALDGEVVVRPGDTLWDLAARHLGSGAGDVAIAAAWPEWYAANRAVIGSDPNLIRPGQRLRPPG